MEYHEKKLMSPEEELYVQSLYCAIRHLIQRDAYVRKIMLNLTDDDLIRQEEFEQHFTDIEYQNAVERVNTELHTRLQDAIERYDLGELPSDISHFRWSYIPF